MNISKDFNNYNFIKLNELNLSPDTKIVILYARFMHNTGGNWTFDTHAHSFYELHFTLNGNCNLVMQNTKDATLGAGNYLLIYPNTNHKFTHFSNDFFRLSVAFDIQRNNKILSEDDKYIIDGLGKNIMSLLKQILLEYNNQKFGYMNLVEFHIQTVIIELLRANPDILDGDKNQTKINRNIFDNSLSFIRNNISLNITADDVAKNVNLSSRQLNRIFTASLNMTIFEFIRNERILRVQEHLRKTSLTLQEIASLTGFNDEYMLCKTFKKITGITPGKYRLKYKKKGQIK